MIKRIKKYFVFYKKDKRYKLWGQTRFEDNTSTVLWQWRQRACWYFLTSIEINMQAYGITVKAFTLKYLGYHIFLRERRYFF
jgi:hypothetical protein